MVTHDGNGYGAEPGAGCLLIRQGWNNNTCAEVGGASEGGGKPYEVTLFYPGTPQKDVALVEAEINKKMEPKIGATLKINAIDWGQWDNKLNLMISSGEKSDIIFTAAWQNYTVNVAKGAFLPLNDLLDAHGQDIKKNLDPAFLEGSQVDGVNYGVPTNKELAATRGVLVRKDLADKYKLDLTAVKTWADLEPLLKTIKENEPAITPFYMSNTNGNGLLENLDWDYLGDASVPGVISKTAGGTTVLNEVETPNSKKRLNSLASGIKRDISTVMLLLPMCSRKTRRRLEKRFSGRMA